MSIPGKPKRSLESAVSSKKTAGVSVAEVIDTAAGLAIVASDLETPLDVRVRLAALTTELQATSNNQARREEVMGRVAALVGQSI